MYIDRLQDYTFTKKFFRINYAHLFSNFMLEIQTIPSWSCLGFV